MSNSKKIKKFKCEECGKRVILSRMYKCKLHNQKLCHSCFMEETQQHKHHPLNVLAKKDFDDQGEFYHSDFSSSSSDEDLRDFGKGVMSSLM